MSSFHRKAEWHLDKGGWPESCVQHQGGARRSCQGGASLAACNELAQAVTEAKDTSGLQPANWRPRLPVWVLSYRAGGRHRGQDRYRELALTRPFVLFRPPADGARPPTPGRAVRLPNNLTDIPRITFDPSHRHTQQPPHLPAPPGLVCAVSWRGLSRSSLADTRPRWPASLLVPAECRPAFHKRHRENAISRACCAGRQCRAPSPCTLASSSPCGLIALGQVGLRSGGRAWAVLSCATAPTGPGAFV